MFCPILRHQIHLKLTTGSRFKESLKCLVREKTCPHFCADSAQFQLTILANLQTPYCTGNPLTRRIPLREASCPPREAGGTRRHARLTRPLFTLHRDYRKKNQNLKRKRQILCLCTFICPLSVCPWTMHQIIQISICVCV